MPGALTFGAATGDRVDCGAGASLTNLDPFTWWAWLFPTTLTNARAIATKNQSAANRKSLVLDGTGGNVRLIVIRATTNTSYGTSDTPLSATSTWIFLAATFNSGAGAGQVVNIYKGTLGALAVESSYAATPADGAGAVTTETAASFLWGNSFNGTASAFQGRIGPCGAFNIELTLAQVQSIQRISRNQVGGTVAKGFWRLGNEGTGSQRDYSGNANAGTVTGATQSNGPPLGDFGRRPSGVYVPHQLMAA